MTERAKLKNMQRSILRRVLSPLWICIFPLVIVMVAVVNQTWLQLANPEPNVIAYNYWSQARDVQERLLVVIAVTVMSMVGSLYLSRRHRLRNDNFINPNASRWSRSLLITLILAVAVGGNIVMGAFIRGDARVLDTEIYVFSYYPTLAEFESRYVLTFEPITSYIRPSIRLYECAIKLNWCELVADEIAEDLTYDEGFRLIGRDYGVISIRHTFFRDPIYTYIPDYIVIDTEPYPMRSRYFFCTDYEYSKSCQSVSM